MNIEYLCGSVHCNDEEALIELCNKYHYDLFKIDNNYYDIESYGTRYEHIQELKSITYDIIRNRRNIPGFSHGEDVKWRA